MSARWAERRFARIDFEQVGFYPFRGPDAPFTLRLNYRRAPGSQADSEVVRQSTIQSSVAASRRPNQRSRPEKVLTVSCHPDFRNVLGLPAAEQHHRSFLLRFVRKPESQPEPVELEPLHGAETTASVYCAHSAGWAQFSP